MLTKKQIKEITLAIAEFERSESTYPDWLDKGMESLAEFFEDHGVSQPELKEFRIRIKENKIKALQTELQRFKERV